MVEVAEEIVEQVVALQLVEVAEEVVEQVVALQLVEVAEEVVEQVVALQLVEVAEEVVEQVVALQLVAVPAPLQTFSWTSRYLVAALLPHPSFGADLILENLRNLWHLLAYPALPHPSFGADLILENLMNQRHLKDLHRLDFQERVEAGLPSRECRCRGSRLIRSNSPSPSSLLNLEVEEVAAQGRQLEVVVVRAVVVGQRSFEHLGRKGAPVLLEEQSEQRGAHPRWQSVAAENHCRTISEPVAVRLASIGSRFRVFSSAVISKLQPDDS